MIQQKILLDASDLMREYGFPRVRTYQILNDASLPIIHLGRRLFVRRSDFEAWLDKQTKRDD